MLPRSTSTFSTYPGARASISACRNGASSAVSGTVRAEERLATFVIVTGTGRCASVGEQHSRGNKMQTCLWMDIVSTRGIFGIEGVRGRRCVALQQRVNSWQHRQGRQRGENKAADYGPPQGCRLRAS